MGMLVDGVWRDEWYDAKSTGGRFVRKESAFRNWVTPTVLPGQAGSAASERSEAAIISTCRSPAREPTER